MRKNGKECSLLVRNACILCHPPMELLRSCTQLDKVISAGAYIGCMDLTIMHDYKWFTISLPLPFYQKIDPLFSETMILKGLACS